MGSWCSTPDPTPAAPQVVTQQADPLFRDAFASVYSRANNAATQPYQPYGQPRIAGLTPDTLSSFDATRSNVGQFQPYLGLAGQQAAQAGQSLSQRNLSDYMNPYTQGVVDVAKREAVRGDDIARQGRNYAANKANAFGGSRHAIVEAEAGRNLGQRLDDIQTQGQAAAYDKALSAINSESTNQSRSAAVLGDLGQKQQSLGTADAAALNAIGTQQQTQDQAGLDQMYKDFLTQRDWDKDQATYLSGILNGAPAAATNKTTESTQFTPQSSALSQAAGLGTAGLGLYGLSKWLFAEGGEVGYSNMSDQELWQEALKYKDTNPPKFQQLRDMLAMRKTAATQKKPSTTVNLGNIRDEANRAAPGTEDFAPRSPETSRASYDMDPGEGTGPATLAQAPSSSISLRQPEMSVGLAAPQRTAMEVPQAPKISLGKFDEPKMGQMTDLDAAAQQAAGMQTPDAARKAVTARSPELLKKDDMPAWIMPVLRAGLGMMQAKPGQSALAGIGAGAEQGIAQAAADRGERRQTEIENQRRRERAEDVTMRDRDAAARDAQSAIDNKFKQIGVSAEKNKLTLDEFRTRLQTAVEKQRITVDQAKLALDGYRTSIEAAKLPLEERRVAAGEKTADATSEYYKRPSEIGTDDKGDVVVLDNNRQPRTLTGVKPKGVGPRDQANLQNAWAKAREQATLQLFGKDGGLLPGQVRSPAQQKQIDDLSRRYMRDAGYEIEGGSDTMSGPPLPKGLGGR